MTERAAKIQTLNTHVGLFAVNRLNFGVATAPAIFQGFMAEHLKDFGDNICILLDDLLLAGETLEELEELEVQVLQKT